MFSDVFDYNEGVISLNMDADSSRIQDNANEFVKAGKMTQEEADALVKSVLADIEAGDLAELKVPQIKSNNEGLFRTKTFNFA